MTRLEFLTLLQSRFRHVTCSNAQSSVRRCLPKQGRWCCPQVFDRRGSAHFEACAGLPRAPILVAVASDDEKPAPFSVSLYVHRSDLETRLCVDSPRSQDQVSRMLAALSEAAARTAEATCRGRRTSCRGHERGRTMRNGCALMWNRGCVSRIKSYRHWIACKDHCDCSCGAICHCSAGKGPGSAAINPLRCWNARTARKESIERNAGQSTSEK